LRLGDFARNLIEDREQKRENRPLKNKILSHSGNIRPFDKLRVTKSD